MSRPPDEFALRKELIVARSSLSRLRLRYDAAELRESLTPARAGAAMARSPAGRTAAFLVAVELAGPARIARLLAFAGRALLAARLVNLLVASLREPQPPPQPPAPPAP
jgi:hypothetical protein